jgi:putative membrane protein
MKKIIGTAFIATLLGVAPLSALPVAAQNAPGGDSLGMSGTTTPGSLDRQDQMFLENAATVGLAQVKLGKLAEEKAQSPEVKQFGQRMVTDHSQADQELKAAAKQERLSVPSRMTSEESTLYSRLSKQSGKDFDRTYMQAMVSDHQKDVVLFRKEAQSGQDPKLKNFAQTTLPTLQQHLQEAQTIDRALGGQ